MPQIFIWNYHTKALVKSFEASPLPVRCGAFIARKSWIVAGCDDMHLRVYNYNTLDKVHAWEAHQDYIRSVAIHPSQPFLLSSSDDMLIKLWDWDKDWQCTRVFEGHSHYVMQICFNPKDPNVFASASLDRTIKVWSLGSPDPNFTLDGHEKGVNCIAYYAGGDKPYLISGGDDFSVKVWDYQNKKCIQTMEAHTNNVTVVGFHPTLPVIVTGSEDSTVRIWHADTYRLEKTLNYGFERVWSLGFLKGSNMVALGYDDGTVVIKIGSENPCISMDHAGKIIWAQQMEVQQANLQRLSEEIEDGERLSLVVKDLGRTELYPHALQHNSNGRFVAVVGDGDYVIYTALAWRQKSFGTGLDFAWAQDPKEYAVRESASRVKVFRSFKERTALRPAFSAEAIYGGALLAVRGARFVCLYDWEKLRLIRRIDVVPKEVYWAESGEMVTIACEASFYILRFNRAIVEASPLTDSEEGIEGAFDVKLEVSERVVTAAWIGDCFVYTNTENRLNYCIGTETVTIAHLDNKMYLLGYLPKINKLFLADKALNVTAYTLHVSIINYQTAVLRGDLNAAAAILPSIPKEFHERISQFLEAQGHKEAALAVCSDMDRKFELAVSLDRLDVAAEIAAAESSDYKWKQLADLALAQNNLPMAEKAMQRAEDVTGLLLLYLATANGVGLQHLAAVAAARGRTNVSFAALFYQGRIAECLALLVQSNRFSEAALMARTYLPSRVAAITQLWKAHLAKTNPRAAELIADPSQYPNLFPNLVESLDAEKFVAATHSKPRPAVEYAAMRIEAPRDWLAEGQAWVAASQAPLIDLSTPKKQEHDCPAASESPAPHAATPPRSASPAPQSAAHPSPPAAATPTPSAASRASPAPTVEAPGVGESAGAELGELDWPAEAELGTPAATPVKADKKE